MDRRAKRRMENGRMVYYLRSADANLWDAHWKNVSISERFEYAEQGIIPVLDRFAHYLPSHGKIVEAGCGLGQIVLALRKRGYDAEGVEWGEGTIDLVKSIYPDLPIRQGDVSKLDVPDSSYAGYISLGVMEHLIDGPEIFINEARRVLKSGGVAFISVPNIHLLRLCKAKLGLYRGKPERLDFFQYAFTRNEFKRLLIDAAFEVIEETSYDSIKGLIDELPPLRWIFGSKKGRAFLIKMMRLGRRWIQEGSFDGNKSSFDFNLLNIKENNLAEHMLFLWNKLKSKLFRGLYNLLMIVEYNFGHMLFFVCRKTPVDGK